MTSSKNESLFDKFEKTQSTYRTVILSGELITDSISTLRAVILSGELIADSTSTLRAVILSGELIADSTREKKAKDLCKILRLSSYICNILIEGS